MPENLREVHRAGLKRYLETGRRHIDWESAELTGLHKSGTEITLGISVAEIVIHGERTFTGIIRDRKSTRLNSSHSQISYAVFCLKKKKNQLQLDALA